MKVYLTFNPKPDITVYELALLMPFASRMVRPTPPDLQCLPTREACRHFTVIFDPNEGMAVDWVEEYFPTPEAERVKPSSQFFEGRNLG